MASIDLNSLPSDGKTKVIFDPATAEVELRINPFQDVPEPPAVIKVIEGSDVIPSFTRGNFSLIMGKAKSRKTFFCALLVSSFLAKNNEKFRAQPQEKPKVLWFDTEQSRYHLYKTAKRIKDMVGDVAIMNLEMFALRTRNTSERREFIDYVIRKNASAGLVIIDGIRDLVNDINSAQESTEMATTLLHWTAQQDTHIINVLHQNKADNNARGHLGTELTNKAETVISITADDSVSIVEAEYTREMSFKKFGFRINEASLPELCDTPFENKEKPAKTDPNLHHDEKHFKVLNEIFKANQKLKYNELCLQIKIGFQRNGLSFGVNRSREYLVYYKTNKWIEQEDGSQFYKYTRAVLLKYVKVFIVLKSATIMNIRTTEISLFASYFDKKPHCTMSFELFCSAVIYEEFRDAVNEIRSSENKAERDKLKAILPAVTISGVFAERKSECLIKHSGLICLDFDSKDNPSVSDWEEIKKTLSEIKNVAFAALSVSGRGCFAIIPLGFPHRHLEQFKALQMDFIRLGLKIDKACSDVSRLRGMTSDPKAWYNPEARPYMKVPLQAQRNRVNSVNSRDNASSLIDKIVSSGIDITSSYSNWYQIGAALASEYHESGRDYFHSISQAYHDYNFSECNRQYNACLKNHGGYTIGTLFYYARQAGIR